MLRKNIGNQQQAQIKNITEFPKTVWGFYVKHIMPAYWSGFLWWALLSLIVCFDDVLFPNFQRWVVKLLENPMPTGMTWYEYVGPTILLIVGLSMGVTLSNLWRRAISSRFEPGIKNQVSVVLTEYAQSQSMVFWTGRMAGSISSQIGYIKEAFSCVETLWRVLGYLIMICINAGLLFNVNKYIAIMFVIAFVFRALYAWHMRKPIKEAVKDKTSKGSILSGKTMDSLSNYAIVKLFTGQKRETTYLDNPRRENIAAQRHYAFLNRLFWGIPGVLWDIMFGATMFLCAMLFYRGQMDISEIVFSVSVYFHVMGSISFIIDMIPEIVDKIGSATKAYSELIVPIDVQDNADAAELNVKHGKIEFKNVSFKYRNKYVLRDLSLTIKPGERIGIVGPSGAGKTTLVNLLMRFYDANKGDIYIDGQNIHDVTQESLRQNISFIPQDPTMFNRTIRDNIAYGKENATDSEIHRAAKFASADKFICATEKKYDSLVDDRGIKLSGGQRQRIAIARAFLKDAPILILDEATSALDSETEVAIQQSFDKLSSGRTTIAIAHRLSTLRNMDRIIVLDHGHVVEQGTHNSLLRKKGVYARLWKMQSGGFLQEK